MKYFCISDIHGHYEEMMDALDTSGFDSSNADLKKMKKDVTELQRADTVAKYCQKAEEMVQCADIMGAYNVSIF